MRPRAAVVLTGSELVRGQRTDRNGPFLARELVRLGFEPARLIIVGDDADELDAAFHEGLRYELCITSGGLGPTHDDRTVELLAHVTGRKLVLDEALRAEIEGISRRISERFKRPYADFQPGIVKQATLPEGALSLGLAGTAPGVLLEDEGKIAIALPGPPAELQRLWLSALESEPMRRLLARVPPAHDRVVRVYGATESAVARAFEEAGGEGEGLVATICAHDFEIRVDLVAEPGAEERAAEVEEALVESLGRYVFARDGRPVEELVLDACRERGVDARDCRVVHGRARGRAPDLDPRLERRRARRCGRLRERREGGGARGARVAAGRRTALCRPRRPRRWPPASASGWAPTSASR